MSEISRREFLVVTTSAVALTTLVSEISAAEVLSESKAVSHPLSLRFPGF